MSDIQEIENLLNPAEDYFPSYRNEQWSYIPDVNQNAYQNQLMFNTQQVRNQKIVWSDSYISIPLVLANATSYTTTTKLALKNSVLSLVYGITLNAIGGQQIVGETQLQFINNLRLLLDTDSDYLTSMGPQIQFSKDSCDWPTVAATSDPDEFNTMPITFSGTNTTGGISTINNADGTVSATPITGAGTYTSLLARRNANWNKGFYERITFLRMNGFNTNSFECLVFLPLALLHPVFKCLNFPMIGSNFELFIAHSTGNNNTLSPWLCASGVSPPVTTANGGIGMVNGQNNCRLHYKFVELDPKENARFLAKLSSGYKIRRNFLSCEVFSNLTGFQAQTAAPLNDTTISASIVKPVGLYALLFPAGAIASSTIPNVPIGKLKNVTVKVAGVSVFNNTYNQPAELWTNLKERFPSLATEMGGSVLTYKDFLTTHRIHYWDLSKAEKALETPNLPVTVQLTATRDDNVSCDYVFLIEKSNTIQIDMSNSSCNMIVGQNI